MKKIVLTGPESTGKSTLALALSNTLNATLVSEYAREYLEKTKGKYQEKDLIQIAKGQLKKEQKAKRKGKDYLICDTSFLVLKVWSIFKYGRSNFLINSQLEKRGEVLYFLCGIDVPWEYDDLRENPNDRQELYDIYKKELIDLGVEFYELSGSKEERLAKAEAIISKQQMKKEVLKDIYHPEKFRKHGHQLIDQLADFLTSIKNNEISVNNWHSPEEELKFWDNFQEQDFDFKQLIDKVLNRSIKVHHPHYVGHQVAVPMPISALAGLTSNLLNNGMALYEMGAASSAMEKVIMRKFCSAVGYDDRGDGILTSGGTLANLTALLAARKAIADTDIWNEGHNKKLAVMVSEEAHYCVDRAARIMGLGAKGIIKIASDETFCMHTKSLEKELKKAEKQGFKVIAVIGSACSTSTGSYDNLDEIADFCEAKNIWFHVDGAHGAAVVFSEKYRHLVKGIERADSIVMDGHKMLGASALVTALLFKNAENSYAVFHQKAQYLWSDAESPEWFNYGKRTFECTKSMMSLKLYTVLQMYGVQAFKEYVEKTYDLAQTFARMLRENTNFSIAVQPQSNILCFRIKQKEWKRKQLNELNSRVRKELLEEGDFYFVQTELGGKIYLRTTLMNPFTKKKHLKKLLKRISEKTEEVSKKMKR